MAVDAVFERAQLEQVVDVEGEGLGDFAVDFDGPGARGQAAGVLGGVALVDAELVEVVVVGDVVVAGELLAGGGEGAGDGLELGAGADGGARGDELAEAIGGEGRDACRGRAFEEAAAGEVAEVGVAGGDLGGGNVGRFADEHV